ncbi:MAG: DUF3108 domain-containing protein [candidate division WOR-3 bacterium]|nr:DUF3108 domain-containing protein [candidate division WOR-3 bacterium]
MKNIICVILSALLIILNCGKKVVPAIKLSPNNWNEINKYRLLIDTINVGSYQLIYKSISEPEPVIELQSITEIKQAGIISRDSTVLLLRQNNLKPISSSKILSTSGTIITSEIKYHNNKASIKASLPQGKKSIDIPINVNTYDNDQVTTILRAINLAPNEEKEINVAIGLSGTTVPLKIKLVGEDKIKVPAGEFDCNKYTLSVVGRNIDIWYEKTDTKRMVKYYDAQANMTMELLL